MKTQYTKMKNRLVIQTLLIIFIIICGCKGGGIFGQSNKDITYNPYQGTEGLNIEFKENAPPEEVYPSTTDYESKFSALLTIKNQGAYDVEEGVLALSTEKDYLEFKKGEDLIYFDITGKNRFDKTGGEEMIEYLLLAKKLISQTETHTTKIIATACYKYKTEISASICMDTDIYNIRTNEKEKICKIQDLTYSGQGAPVEITRIETQILPNEEEQKITPQFIIHIQNSGNGQVVEKIKSEDFCSGKKISFDSFNTVYVNAYIPMPREQGSSGEIEMAQLTCKPALKNIDTDLKTGLFKFREESDYVTCNLPEGVDKSMGAYTTILKIELEYAYTTSVSKNIIIRKEQ